MIQPRSFCARGIAASLIMLSLSGCATMDENQQRLISGSVIGVATGAVTTVVTGGCIACGMAIGGALGAAGGYLVGKIDENTRSSPPAPPAPLANNVPQSYPPGGYAQ